MRARGGQDEYIIPELVCFKSDQAERQWIKDAACRGIGTDMFYLERGDWHKIGAARELCASCKVREQCAEYGAYERYGIWGGMNYKERVKWRTTNNVDYNIS